jgi:hypothetical protein
VKTLIISSLLAACAGGAVGAGLGYQHYGAAIERFGPFSIGEPLSIAETRQLLEQQRVKKVPKIEVVGGNIYDFGVMRRNAKATHSFTIKNVGDGPLDLRVTGSTCKCTVGTLRNGTLAPGESTVVDMEWEAKTTSRTFGQSATLKTTDPTQGELSLEVRGTVVDLIDAEPASWNLGDVAASGEIELQTTLYNHSQSPIKITDVSWLDPKFQSISEIEFVSREITAEDPPAHQSASEAYDLKIVVAAGVPQGPLNQRLRIDYRNRGDDEEFPPLELVLTGRAVSAISFLGGPRLAGEDSGRYRLNMGLVEPGTQAEEKVYVVLRGPHRDATTLSIGPIDPEDVLEAELGEATTRGEMKVIPLTVRTKKTAPEVTRTGQAGTEAGTITLESDNPEVAATTLNVIFRVGRPRDSL